MNEPRLLHIYAQDYWHTPAFIVGDVTALTALRDALNRALENGVAGALAFCNDGEGYNAIVAKVDEETFNTLSQPYTDECCAGGGGGQIGPWELPRVVEAIDEARASKST